MSETVAGFVKNGVVVPNTPLPEGAEVLITPVPPQPGTPAALLAAMETEPYLAKEDGEELGKAIAHGRRPLGRIAP